MSFLFKQNKRPAKAPVNPLDKSTIFSIFPKPIDENKATLEPGRFVLEPGSFEKPALLVVGPSSWWKDVGEDQPLLEIPTASVIVASSIVRDYCNGFIGADMENAKPGLFYLPGEWTVRKLMNDEEGKAMLNAANKKQRAWYENLVKLADVNWARTNGNPLSINDDMRLAARELNLIHSKEWVKDRISMDMVRCPACGTFKNPEFPVCSNCKTVTDKKKAEELGLAFAK